MQCKNCDFQNPYNARYCIKCGTGLIENSSDEYCPNCKRPLLYPDKPCPYCENAMPKVEQSFCAECKSSLKKGMMFSNIGKLTPLERSILELDSSKSFCDKCVNLQKTKSLNKLNVLKAKYKNFLKEMPVLSVENPKDLTITKYCRVVTSQSVVKTEAIPETDLHKDIWNNTGNEFEYKINQGEKNCILSLKKNALKLGANAIIGCDIDYAEINSTNHHAFMIAMLGTAVIVEEYNILPEYEQNIYNQLLAQQFV